MKKTLLEEELFRIHELMGVSTANVIKEMISDYNKSLITEGRLDLLDFKRFVTDAASAAKTNRSLIAPAELDEITRIYDDLVGRLNNETDFVARLDELRSSTKTAESDFAKAVDAKVLSKLNTDYNTEFTELATELSDVKTAFKAKHPNMTDADIDNLLHLYIEDMWGKGVKLEDGTTLKKGNVKSPYLRKKVIENTKTRAGLDPAVTGVRASATTELTVSERLKKFWEGLTSTRAKLESAMVLLKTASSETEFVSALTEYLDAYSKLIKDLPPKYKDKVLNLFPNKNFDTWKTDVLQKLKTSYDDAVSRATKDLDEANWIEYVQSRPDAELRTLFQKAGMDVTNTFGKKVKASGANEKTVLALENFLKAVTWYPGRAYVSSKPALAKWPLQIGIRALLSVISTSLYNATVVTLKKDTDEDGFTFGPVTLNMDDWMHDYGLITNLGKILVNSTMTLPNFLISLGTYVNYNRTEKSSTPNAQLNSYVDTLEQNKYDFSLNTESSNKLNTFIKNIYKGKPEYEMVVKALTAANTAVQDGKSLTDIQSQIEAYPVWQIWSSSLPTDSNLTAEDYRDMVYGLPMSIGGFGGQVNQIRPYAGDFYYITANNMFKIEDFEGENPYIVGIKDGDEEKIFIKDIFFNDVNKYLPGVKSTNTPAPGIKAMPASVKPGTGYGGEADKYENTLGLLSGNLIYGDKINTLREQAEKAGKSLDLSKYGIYNFYKEGDYVQIPNFPNEYSAKTNSDGTIAIPSGEEQIFYSSDDNKMYRLYYNDYGDLAVNVYNKSGDSISNTKMTRGNWYARGVDDNKWHLLTDLLKDKAPGSTNAPGSSAAADTEKSPKEKWEDEHPGVKLTQSVSFGELVTYSGSDGKNYKLENGKIVEF